MEKFNVVNKLGEGAYGTVCRAKNKETREIVAIKTIKKRHSSLEECLNLPEVKCLSKLGNGHPNIVLLKQLFYTVESRTLHIVFECMDCTLKDLIKRRANSRKPFSESKIRDYAFQVLQGLAYMHREGYMHCDIKPGNLLVSKGTIKIADFGFAKEEVVGGADNYTKFVGTRWYKAPELFLNCEKYTSAIDIWSMGVVLTEMFNLKPPFQGEDTADQIYKICGVIECPQMPKEVCMSSDHIPTASMDALSLIRWMCSWDPLMRPTAKEALQHPFFRGRVV